MNKIILENLEELQRFLAIIAPISFTVTGLVLVTLGGDQESREAWFRRRSHRIYANATFILFVLPGLLSLGGLIPSWPNARIPAWPITTALISLLYFWIGRVMKDGIAELLHPQEFARLEIRIIGIQEQFELYGIPLFVLATLAYFLYWNSISEGVATTAIFFSGILVSMLFLSALNLTALLRASDKLVKQKKPISRPVQPKTSKPMEIISLVESKDDKEQPILTGCLAILLMLIIGSIVEGFSKLANRDK